MNPSERSGLPLRLSQATKRYAGQAALDDVSLDFEPGEIIAIVGLNGAGKSTMLKAASGLINLNAGSSVILGQALRRENLEQRRQLVFLPDLPFLIPEETVFQNVSRYLDHYECLAPESIDRAGDLLVELELAEKAETVVAQLSRGQSYKTALAALITINPPFWLLDEPFASGMDAQGIATFRREAKKAAETTDAGVIYTTQLIDLARDFSDRICVIDRGKVIALESYATLREMAEADSESPLNKLF